MKKQLLVVALFFLGIYPQLSFSQENADRFYLGAGVSHIDQKDACDGSSISCDDTDVGGKIFLGYQYSSLLSIEAGYVDLGKTDASINVLGVPASIDVDAHGFFLSGQILWPVSSNVDIYGKIGAAYWDLETKAKSSGVSISLRDKGTGVLYGLGVEYKLNTNLGLRAEWERFNNVGGSDTGETDIDLLSTSISYRF